MAKRHIEQPEAGPSTKRTRRESSLEAKWEIVNAKIRGMVYREADAQGLEGDELLANALLLAFIWAPMEVQTRQIVCKYECMLKLLEDHPDIKPVLQSAIDSGHYEHIFSLPALTGEDRKVGDEEKITGENRVSSRTASVAWTAQYHGHYHEVMLDAINSTDRRDIYASSAAIIQSSGTGKSRMVHELASLVFTIPFNLRDPREREGSAYPPEDGCVRQYLCTVSSLKIPKHGEARAALFLKHVFSRVAKELKRVISEPESKLSPGDLAGRWRKHLSEETRSLLYKKIISACEKEKALLDGSFTKIIREAEDQLLKLLTILHTRCASPNPNDVKVLLYFDEAHELRHPIPGDEQNKNLYDVLCSALNRFENPSIFTLFLSTQSSMGLLAPSTKVARSRRQRSAKNLPALFTETPFDCHPTFPLTPGTLKLEQLGELSFLARFGRPLFWTMIEASKVADKSELIASTMDLAREKLINSCDFAGMKQDSVAMLAVLDVLITIEYEPRRDLARDRELEMIASHMRIAFSVSQHRCYIRSGYPSEPFLAEAASRQMYHYLKSPDYTMAKLLQANFDNGLIDLGQKGEVVMRLLLRMAYMNAITAEQAGEIQRTHEPNFSRGCNFLVFLKALFADRFHDVILTSTPNNGAPSTGTLKAAFKHAVVRFTHFIKALDDSVVSTRSMVTGFLRGAAFICHNHQKDVDIVIPVLLDKDDALEEPSMTALFIQVKRRRRPDSSTDYIIDEGVHHFFPKEASMKQPEEGPTGEHNYPRPYVALVAELGVSNPPKKTPFVVTDDNGGHSSKEHPRYSFRTYGCTEIVWKVISAAERERYQHILGTDDVLGDHPRQDAVSLQLVRRMLPFWDDCGVWYDDGTLKPSKKRKEKKKSKAIEGIAGTGGIP